MIETHEFQDECVAFIYQQWHRHFLPPDVDIPTTNEQYLAELFNIRLQLFAGESCSKSNLRICLFDHLFGLSFYKMGRKSQKLVEETLGLAPGDRWLDILDVGSGDGRMTKKYFKPFANHLVGLDLSPFAGVYAQDFLPHVQTVHPSNTKANVKPAKTSTTSTKAPISDASDLETSALASIDQVNDTVDEVSTADSDLAAAPEEDVVKEQPAKAQATPTKIPQYYTISQADLEPVYDEIQIRNYRHPQGDANHSSEEFKFATSVDFDLVMAMDSLVYQGNLTQVSLGFSIVRSTLSHLISKHDRSSLRFARYCDRMDTFSFPLNRVIFQKNCMHWKCKKNNSKIKTKVVGGKDHRNSLFPMLSIPMRCNFKEGGVTIRIIFINS